MLHIKQILIHYTNINKKYASIILLSHYSRTVDENYFHIFYSLFFFIFKKSEFTEINSMIFGMKFNHMIVALCCF